MYMGSCYAGLIGVFAATAVAIKNLIIDTDLFSDCE